MDYVEPPRTALENMTQSEITNVVLFVGSGALAAREMWRSRGVRRTIGHLY